MALHITIDVFSGRENPTFVLDGERANQVASRVSRFRSRRALAAPAETVPVLGYRGIAVREAEAEARPAALSAPEPRQAARASRQARPVLLSALAAPDPEMADVEEMLLELSREPLGAELHARIARELDRSRSAESPLRLAAAAAIAPPPPPDAEVAGCQCAPPFRPSSWNDGGFRQATNNCYNYSTNYRTDTFAQPGRAAGAMYSAFTGVSVRQAAVRDDLINRPGANNRCPEEDGAHLIALVIAPGLDFHWYRKGPDGLWSHKVGPAPVTNLDNAGQLITDPRTAARGPYTQFTTFMVVMHDRIKIV